jgi:DNA polymerase-3 subunit delta
LGSDRRASRGEVQKLALYARGAERIEVDDVLAVVADAAALAVDAVIDASFAGKTQDLERELGRATTSGVAANAIIGSALRQAMALHKARLVVDAGASIDDALGRFVPPIHFKRRSLVEAAIKAWAAARLEALMLQLADAALDVRRRPTLADTIAQRALLAVAVAARRK